MHVTYKLNGFREVTERDGYILLQQDLLKIRPFPAYVTVQSQMAGHLKHNASAMKHAIRSAIAPKILRHPRPLAASEAFGRSDPSSGLSRAE